MRTHAKRLWRYTRLGAALLGCGLAAFAVAGCTVADTSSLQLNEPTVCRSDLGAYYLPKHYLTVAVERAKIDGKLTYRLVPFYREAVAENLGTGKRAAVIGNLAPTRDDMPKIDDAAEKRYVRVDVRADIRHGYCMDYIQSLTSSDALIVNRSEHGLLTQVATKGKFYNTLQAGGEITPDPETTDGSTEIAKRIIRGAFRAAAGGAPHCTTSNENLAVGGPEFNAYCSACKDKPASDSACKDHLNKLVVKYNVNYRPDPAFRIDERDPFTKVTETSVLHKYDKSNQPYLEYQDRSTELRLRQEREEALRKIAIQGLVDDGQLAFNVDYDPTSLMQSAYFNKELSAYGFCIVLDDGSVNLRKFSSYCSDPVGYAEQRGWHREDRQARKSRPGKFGTALEADARGDIRHFNNGILYRPRVTYTVHIFQRVRDNGGQIGWQLFNQDRVQLANAAPIISIGVGRAMFAKRNTVLSFNQGSLHTVDLQKQSELAGAAEVPLAIVQSVARLPTQIIQVRIDNSVSSAELIRVNEQLISTHIGYVNAERGLKEAEEKVAALPGASAEDPARRTQLINQCALVIERDYGAQSNAKQACFDIVTMKYGAP